MMDGKLYTVLNEKVVSKLSRYMGNCDESLEDVVAYCLETPTLWFWTHDRIYGVLIDGTNIINEDQITVTSMSRNPISTAIIRLGAYDYRKEK